MRSNNGCLQIGVWFRFPCTSAIFSFNSKHLTPIKNPLFACITIALITFFTFASGVYACNNDLHLVILSGQSNMARLPVRYFSGAIHGEIGTNHTVIVKHAIGGMPISMWDETLNGRIYKTMMGKVQTAIEGKEITSITFIWMQGESDVIWGRTENYLNSFNNLLSQLKRDLGRDDIRLIIGRINDWGHSESWYQMRALQEFIGDTCPGAEWVDTDDLNGPYNGVHCTPLGFKTLAERYADIILDFICEEKGEEN